jgi:DNA-directed RNA polymerase sigma subunit (sigma70/sigma32)
MPLPRKVCNLIIYDRVELNAYDVRTKKIIFTGTASEVGIFLGVSHQRVRDALKKKYRLLKLYAIRTKSTKEHDATES